MPPSLSFRPSTPHPPPSHFSSPYLSQCQVGSAIRAHITQVHALTRTHTSRAELGYNLPSHFPRRHHLPCITSQTHPPLPPGGQGLLSGREVSPSISSLPPPFSLSLFLGFLGEDPKAKKAQTSFCPTLNLRSSARMGSYVPMRSVWVKTSPCVPACVQGI